LRVRRIVVKKSFSKNNIYAKTVHKEYSTPQELHPITSAGWFEGAMKLPNGRSPGSFSFNSIFIYKKAHL